MEHKNFFSKIYYNFNVLHCFIDFIDLIYLACTEQKLINATALPRCELNSGLTIKNFSKEPIRRFSG